MRTSIYTVLKQFVENRKHKTLLLKGKWGVGKTFAVRRFLFSETCPVKTFSYVSLSGVSTVSDERSLAISGLEQKDGRPPWERSSKEFAWLGKAAIKWISGGSGVGDLGYDAILNLFASRVLKSAIVVLDDIERKAPTLQLSAIFGAVSRLTEIRESRVIVIMNEEELFRVDGEARELLSNQREKIFDREFEFRPSVEEALKLVELKETAEYVEPVARRLEINNLRVLQKIAWAVEELSEHLLDLNAAVRSRLLAQVAGIAAIRLRAQKPLLAEDLVSGFHFKLVEAFHHKPNVAKTEPENPFRGDLEALEYNPLPTDTVLLQFLDSGSFDIERFKIALPDLTALDAEEKLNKQREAISGFIWGKFGSLNREELDCLQQILDCERIGTLSSGDLAFFQKILQIHGRTSDGAALELRWAQRVPVDHPSLGEDKLQTEKARDTLRARIVAAREPGAPQTFKEVLDRGRLSLRFLQSAEASDPLAIEKVLCSLSERYLIAKVTKLLREAQSPDQQLPELSPFLPSFEKALLDALESLSAKDEMNKIRVESIISKSKRSD